MRIRLGTLRELIKEVLLSENYGTGEIAGKNVLAPDLNAREQIGAISAKAIDTVDDPDGLPEHLREPQEDPQDCYGPVPPDAEPVGVYSDPYTRDTSPTPTGNIKR